MYEIEEIKNKIICGDALEELKKFPDESIDCVICSPPYYYLRNIKNKQKYWYNNYMLPRDKKGRFIKGYHYNPQTEFKKGKHWRSPKLYWNKDWLEREYVELQKSSSVIAREQGCKTSNILYFLKKFGIKRRNISEARKIQYWGLSGEKNPMYGKRGDKNPNWKGGSSPLRQKFYSSLEWKRLFKEVRKRDKNYCWVCLNKFLPKELEIHHILPFSLFPEHRLDINNLTTVCKNCHKKLTAIDIKTIRVNLIVLNIETEPLQLWLKNWEEII